MIFDTSLVKDLINKTAHNRHESIIVDVCKVTRSVTDTSVGYENEAAIVFVAIKVLSKLLDTCSSVDSLSTIVLNQCIMTIHDIACFSYDYASIILKVCLPLNIVI